MSAADEGKLDSAVVAALFEQHSQELLRFLVGVVRDHQLASDALQAAFTKMVERGHETSEESRKAWLFRVAYNEALLVRRRQKTGKSVLERVAWSSDLYKSDDSLVQQEDVERVQAAIDQLPPDQQRVVRMRIYEEKTFAVIAAELNIPLGTALGRMRTALEKLRNKLGSD